MRALWRFAFRSATLLAVALAVLHGWPGAGALAADSTIVLKSQGSAPVDLSAPLFFSDTVKLAMARTESLRMTQIDIEVGKKTEQDMWYKLFPKLNLIANYDVPVTQGSDSGSDPKPSLNISFSTGSYDPIAAYIGHDASRISVKIAEMLHIVALQKVLENIGLSFINQKSLNDVIACRRSQVSALESLAQFVETKVSGGSLSRLELKAAQQRLALARLELSQAEKQLVLERRNLKRLLGLGDLDNAVFDVDGSQAQLYAGLDKPETLAAENVLKKNLEMRVQALREKLQVYSIRLAQAEHLPKFSFGARTPDPLSNNNSSNPPYYFSMQAVVPIWAWGETVRGVDKAELNMQKLTIAGKVQANKLQEALDDLRLAKDRTAEMVAIAAAKTEIQKLELVRKEIGYNTNGTSLDAVITARETAILAALDEIKARSAYDQARLNLRVVSGSLISDFVRVDYGELEKD